MNCFRPHSHGLGIQSSLTRTSSAVALTDARKDKYGALVDGRSGEKQGQFRTTKRSPVSDGWTLTEAGVVWIKENEARLEVHGGRGSLKSHRQRVLKQLSKVTRHSLYLSYLKKGEEFTPSIGDVAALVRCRVDAPREVWMNTIFYDRK